MIKRRPATNNDIYLVDENHIAYLVNAHTIDESGVLVGFLKPRVRNATELGQLLWDQNAKAVSKAKGEEVKAPKFEKQALGREFEFDPIQVYKSASCYEYQSCDTEEWEKTIAFQYVELLRRIAIRKLPEYELCVWGSPSPKNS